MMRAPALVVLFLLLPAMLAAGDLFAIGARAGIPLTDAFENVRSGDFIFESSTRRFTAGPSVELLLPMGFGLEADLLYKKTDATVTTASANDDGGDSLTSVKQSVGVWEIPILAKFRFPGAGLRPYVVGGGAYRNFGDLFSVIQNLDDAGWGFVAGAGIELKIKRLRLSPEIRFTRWGSGQISGAASTVKYSRNQADLLVGITF